MIKHTFLTNMPDKPGSFMVASKIISKHNGNITRVSYNKAVDIRMLFIEVEAESSDLAEIENELKKIGYIHNDLGNPKIIVVSIKIDDKAGALIPVLEILDKHQVNISYLNSSQDASQDNQAYQDFRIGLYIDDTKNIKEILDEISKLYPVEIMDYENNGTVLDNTIFYIRFGNAIQKLFDLDNKQTILLIKESNRIMQMLDDKGENPKEVFAQVLHLATFIKEHKGENFTADITCSRLTDNTRMYTIEPPCGSNVFILENSNELLFIDTGFSIYADEMMDIFHSLMPSFDSMKKTIMLTHADIDHCGLLDKLHDAQIIVNEKNANALRKQYEGDYGYREKNRYCLGYNRLSRVFTNYRPISQDRPIVVLDKNTPSHHEDLIKIGSHTFGDITLDAYEGSGGHVVGELVLISKAPKLVFTGDIYVNIKGFSKERREFNSIAPYLMTSVDICPPRAKEMRKQLMELLEENGKEGFLVCGGHGPIELF